MNYSRIIQSSLKTTRFCCIYIDNHQLYMSKSENVQYYCRKPDTFLFILILRYKCSRKTKVTGTVMIHNKRTV